jgi:hypothetical protein
MSLVQARGVPERTVSALKARAAERGLTLAAYLRIELERLAERPDECGDRGSTTET